jgi:hypothetical protein
MTWSCFSTLDLLSQVTEKMSWRAERMLEPAPTEEGDVSLLPPFQLQGAPTLSHLPYVPFLHTTTGTQNQAYLHSESRPAVKWLYNGYLHVLLCSSFYICTISMVFSHRVIWRPHMGFKEVSPKVGPCGGPPQWPVLHPKLLPPPFICI